MALPKYFLDTNTCVYILNKRPAHVAETFSRHAIGDIGVSSVTVAELAFGAAKSEQSSTRERVERFLLELEVRSFDAVAAWRYGEVRARLARQGTPIGLLDQQIAAHALALGVTLVTNNVREFGRVEGLKVENWF